MFKKSISNSFNKKRLTNSNIYSYLEELYPDSRKRLLKAKRLQVKPLLQNNYGQSNDCTLTSLTTCICHLLNYTLTTDIKKVYQTVEKNAKKYFYNGEILGTLPFFIKKIFDTTLKNFNKTKVTKAKYLKNAGFTYASITKLIDAGTPVVLSINQDGRNYYTNHTVTIVGYESYRLAFPDISKNNKLKQFLIVYDNWYDTYSYLDYELLSPICCINYY